MNITKQRKTLHDTIETLPASQLMMMSEYALYLQSNSSSWDDLPQVQDESLLQLIETIRQTPFNPDSVTLPTKHVDTHIAELEGWQSSPSIDSTKWDDEWDQLEAEWKAERLSHETLEREQDW